MGAGRTFFTVAYRIGLHPWEGAAKNQEYAEKFAQLLDREEDGLEPPFGRALDIGCGSGVWGVELARRGWAVTGVDIVEKAVRRARGRAREAGVDAGFVHGDVTDLGAADVGSGFRLLLDTGTFHALTDAQRTAMGREITAVASPDATLLMAVWAPMNRGPLPRGATRLEVATAFPRWRITDTVASMLEPPPLMRRLKADEHWYRLRRRT
ncbi:class I SAM-dependent methyltransferase [Wenjunlia tyrosinilytica]|uniref:Methyltransferase domain-containing protein n=1 Tax=Wenjunlia tyrosinilytica TaxID=1544741 RepID=A0A917ZRJ6_9ACTN|nr:class I SAM-dependent methyltransferase [Wenjunlia tyrosinilytica]GGO89710.1 hypothetical protein GCM10012280_33580 [Wenjunlia tyrosinilytica]